MPVPWWKRIQYALEAGIILAFVPFALYPSPITLLVLGTLPAAAALLAATVFPRWFARKPRLRRYAHAGAVASSGTAVVATAWIGFLSPPSSIHLLPPDYRGPVTVVFGCPSGRSPSHEGRARIYEIPESGVLLVSDKFEGRQPRIRRKATSNAAQELAWVDAEPTNVGAFGMRATTWSRGSGSGPSAIQYIVGDQVQWDTQQDLFARSLADADRVGAARCEHEPSR